MKNKNLAEIIKKIDKANESAKAKQKTKRIIMKPIKHHFQQGIEETCSWILKDLKTFEAKIQNFLEYLHLFEWIQDNQEDLPLGYSPEQLLALFIKKEILNDG